ncbi:hypothetical protein RB195_016891 [Necator americanus]|uniref:Uncharacterized protein n=1 Tax=Necator americanus TaxID=51031 RepID=A0ABR1C535_NECAM
MWTDTAATFRKQSTTHRALERYLLKFNLRTQHLPRLHNTTPTRPSQLRLTSNAPSPEYTSEAKHIWAGHIMRTIDDRWTKRTLQWIPRDPERTRRRPPNESKKVPYKYKIHIKRMNGPAERSAGYGLKTSATSLRNKKLENTSDDNSEGIKQVEKTLGPAHPVKIQVSKCLSEDISRVV